MIRKGSLWKKNIYDATLEKEGKLQMHFITAVKKTENHFFILFSFSIFFLTYSLFFLMFYYLLFINASKRKKGNLQVDLVS